MDRIKFDSIKKTGDKKMNLETLLDVEIEKARKLEKDSDGPIMKSHYLGLRFGLEKAKVFNQRLKTEINQL